MRIAHVSPSQEALWGADWIGGPRTPHPLADSPTRRSSRRPLGKLLDAIGASIQRSATSHPISTIYISIYYHRQRVRPRERLHRRQLVSLHAQV